MDFIQIVGVVIVISTVVSTIITYIAHLCNEITKFEQRHFNEEQRHFNGQQFKFQYKVANLRGSLHQRGDFEARQNIIIQQQLQKREEEQVELLNVRLARFNNFVHQYEVKNPSQTAYSENSYFMSLNQNQKLQRSRSLFN